MANRDNFQKIETEFSIDILLFRYRKWYKNTSLVYFDSLFIVADYSNNVGKQKDVFHDSGIDSDAFVSHLDLMWVVTEGRRTYENAQRAEIKVLEVYNCHFFEGVGF